MKYEVTFRHIIRRLDRDVAIRGQMIVEAEGESAATKVAADAFKKAGYFEPRIKSVRPW